MRAGIPEETPPVKSVAVYGSYKIIRNAAQCARCQDVIESKHRHDFVSCQCGAIFVDGGRDYLRCGGDLDDLISLVETEAIPDDNETN